MITREKTEFGTEKTQSVLLDFGLCYGICLTTIVLQKNLLAIAIFYKLSTLEEISNIPQIQTKYDATSPLKINILSVNSCTN